MPFSTNVIFIKQIKYINDFTTERDASFSKVLCNVMLGIQINCVVIH